MEIESDRGQSDSKVSILYNCGGNAFLGKWAEEETQVWSRGELGFRVEGKVVMW